jgi:hypothetical protein
MVKEKLVAPRRAELALLEEDANLGPAAVLLWSALQRSRAPCAARSPENDLFQLQLPPTPAPWTARSITSRETLCLRAFSMTGEARVTGGIGATELGRDHNFLNQFAGDLAFLQARHFALGMQPLTTHAPY